MIASRAQRHPLALIALALCLWLSPALTLAADLHELVHELNGEHAVDLTGQHHHAHGSPARALDHDHDHDHAAADAHDDGDSDSRDPVHLLVHCVHTCGGAFAGLPAVLAVGFSPLAIAVEVPVAAPLTDAPVSALLRPPRAG